MLRPAERFTVNIAPAAAPETSRPLGWPVSMPTMLVAATIVGAGIGGMIPSGQPPSELAAPTLEAAAVAADDVAAIEPAAGPAESRAEDQEAALIARAPDGAFYATAALDSVPVTMRLDPQRHRSVLLARDAARLVAGGIVQPTLQVQELALQGHVSGPVELMVADEAAPASVLGADLLADFSVVEIDRDHLRLVAR